MAIAVTLGLVERLKNSDFVLENKMTELNIKIQNYKIDQMLCETLFYLGNKWIAYLTQLFHVFTESLYWTFRKSFEEAVKLGSFLQCSTYIFRARKCLWKINNFVEPCHEELPRKAYSTWLHQILQNIFSWKL